MKKALHKNRREYRLGFALIELLLIIIIIGILATILIVSYNGVQRKAVDTGVLSDLDIVDGLETNYGLENHVAGKDYYSGSGVDSDLRFTPSNGNVIDVVIDSTDYCIRGYNTKGTKSSIFDSFEKESSVGICDILGPSAAALGINPKITINAGGGGHSCGLNSAGGSFCWGYNLFGELGDGTTVAKTTPAAVSTSGALNGKTVKSIVGGNNHSCALASNSLVYCWGLNSSGQLGNNSTSNSYVPVAVSTSGVLNNKTIKMITAGYSHSCVIASDDKLYCWGYNSSGELGNNSTTNSSVPVAVNTAGVLSGKSLQFVSAGSYNSCAVDKSGLAYCWGRNDSGELCNGNTTSSSVPVAVVKSGVLSGKTIRMIDSGGYLTCVIASDYKAYCWGHNTDGQLGNGTTVASSIPVAVNVGGVLNSLYLKSISVGYSHVCAIASDEKAYCWGDNFYGQLGNNSNNDSSVPVAVVTSGVLNGKRIKSVIASSGVDGHTCATDTNNQVYCWGRGEAGRLGNGSVVDSKVPVITQLTP